MIYRKRGMMEIHDLSHALPLFLAFMTACGLVGAQGSDDIELPAPRIEGGRPLMECLKDRMSARRFSREEIPLQTLSDLLWAAWGVNRPESHKRTAPSAVNWQEIDVYVATARALYKFDAANHRLEHVLNGDIRALTGMQDFVAVAPLNLLFVADRSRMGRASPEDRDFYAACDAGFISQNVYLFCASEGLATVVRGALDRDRLAKAMKLSDSQKIVLAQTIGFPVE